MQDQCQFQLALVMLVDDDPFMLEYLADMLDDLGVGKILKMLDARSALRELSLNTPNLMICDLSMPDMDGIEFLNSVARLGYRGSVILHSGVNPGVIRAAEKLARARGLRVLGAFEKPISKQVLQNTLARMTP